MKDVESLSLQIDINTVQSILTGKSLQFGVVRYFLFSLEPGWLGLA
jgi:hypothetical protein